MQFNFLIIALAALVPLVMGFIWYNPKIFGTAWMKECNFTLDTLDPPNPIIFLYCYILSLLLAFVLGPIVIHQYGFFSIIMNEPGFQDSSSEISLYAADFMDKYGSNFRTFKHGVLHGALVGIMVILPVFGTNAMFEKRTIKYVLINSGYWIVSIALMGGILCQFV